MSVTKERGYAVLLIIIGSILSSLIVNHSIEFDNLILQSSLPAVPLVIGFAAGLLIAKGEYE